MPRPLRLLSPDISSLLEIEYDPYFVIWDMFALLGRYPTSLAQFDSVLGERDWIGTFGMDDVYIDRREPKLIS